MDRYRWFKTTLPESFAASIGKFPVIEEATLHMPGFVLLEKNKTRCDLQYRWLTNIEAVTLNNGEVSTNIISVINVVNFSLFEKNKNFWIKVKNPPRSLKELLLALELVFGFGFTIEVVLLKPQVLEAILNKLDDHKLISFKANGSVVELQTIFRLEAASKIGINIDSLKILVGTKYALDQSSYEVSHKGYKGQFSSASNGTMKVSGDISPFLLNLIENGLTS